MILGKRLFTLLLWAVGHVVLAWWTIRNRLVRRDLSNADGCAPLYWLIRFPNANIQDIARLLSCQDVLNSPSKRSRGPLPFLWLRGPRLHWAISCRNETAMSALLSLKMNLIQGDVLRQWNCPLALSSSYRRFCSTCPSIFPRLVRLV